MHRHLGICLLSAALLGPAVMMAQEHHEGEQNRPPAYDNANQQHYGTANRSEHKWNEADQREWRHFLAERHEHFHEWTRASRREREEFRKWQHRQAEHMHR